MPGHEATPSPRARAEAARSLGAVVTTIEFTLISVMVGLLLVPLIDDSMPLLRDLRFEYWAYSLCGLLLILDIWAEVVNHSLTLIGWPMDLGHNLLYILLATALGIQMHLLDNPRGWFAISIVHGMLSVTVGYYDLRLLLARVGQVRGAALDLYQAVIKRQRLLLTSALLYVAVMVLSLALIVAFPEVFIERSWHVGLVAFQSLGVIVLLRRTVRTFHLWREPILLKTAEELQENPDL